MSSQIDVQLKDPFSMVVAGERGAGKTTFTKKLLKEENWLIHPTPQRAIWCYAKQQPNLLSDLTEILPAIEYVQGIPSEMDSIFDRSVNNLIILYDMMDDMINLKLSASQIKKYKYMLCNESFLIHMLAMRVST